MAMGRTPANTNAQESSERRMTRSSAKGGMYHCNNCSKDISHVPRIKCNICVDFDLCVECFSAGVELWLHKSSHPYKVLNNTYSVPIISPYWSTEQDMLLLEGLEMFGPSNWADVAEHVGTKSAQECYEHYSNHHLSMPNFVPVTKNVDEIAVMAKGKGKLSIGKGRKSSRTTGSSSKAKDQPSEANREKALDLSSIDLNGSNPKSPEIEVEYDNDAEKLLVGLKLSENDTELERELKVRVLRMYKERVEERKRRKDFIIERGLLHPNPIEKDFTPEEKQLCRKFDPFMRFHSKEEHNQFLNIVVEEHRTLTRIKELEEARAAGCNTLAKANKYIEIKKRLIAEGKLRTATRGSSGSSSSDKSMPDPPLDPSSAPSAFDHFLSEAEKQLCLEIGYSAQLYMKLQDVMAQYISKKKITRKRDMYLIFAKFEPNKLDKVYDMLVKKGLAPPS